MFKYFTRPRRVERSILHLEVGNENWLPTPSELSELSALFLAAEFDPAGSVVATRPGVRARYLNVPLVQHPIALITLGAVLGTAALVGLALARTVYEDWSEACLPLLDYQDDSDSTSLDDHDPLYGEGYEDGYHAGQRDGYASQQHSDATTGAGEETR